MNNVKLSICLAFCLLHNTAISGKPCFDSTTARYEGETWIYNDNLKVVCKKGEIVPLSCVTKLGTTIPLGTAEFQENDITYSCLLDETAADVNAEGSGSGEGELLAVGQPECSAKTIGLEWSDDNGFAYQCVDQGATKIVGCVADNGRTVGNGQAFVTYNGALKICRIGKNGEDGRIENKGCFTGSTNSKDIDENDANSLNHKKKYSTWRIGDIEYRCGDQGIYTFKCFVEIKGKQTSVFSNSVWLDSDGGVQFCG